MYVSYLLEKDAAAMYPGSMRAHPGLHNYPTAPQYPDYAGYHTMGIEHGAPSSGSSTGWITPYGPPRDEWGVHPTYSPGHSHINPSPVGNMTFSPDYSPAQVQGQPCIGVLPAGPPPPAQLSPESEDEHRRHHYEWLRKPVPQANIPGSKTRTKDKYRVVYTDQQRLELEKEFHYSRYITIRRKAELAVGLGLSERQVKIWFQNRRAKERKINKKRIQQTQAGQNGPDTLSPEPSINHHMIQHATSNVGGLPNAVAQ